MIRDIERYHGIVLARLIRADMAVNQIRSHPSIRSAYVLNESVGLYVKYSTSRLSPWKFNFQLEHRSEIATLASEIGRLSVILVCGLDGIVALDEAEIVQLLGERDDPLEWVRVDRIRNQMYGVSGSAGRLAAKVADNAFPGKVFGLAVSQRIHS